MAIAKPCYDCLPVIQAAGIRHVYYSDREGNMVKENASTMSTNHKCASHYVRLARLNKQHNK